MLMNHHKRKSFKNVLSCMLHTLGMISKSLDKCRLDDFEAITKLG